MLADRCVHATLPNADVDALRPLHEGVLGFAPLAVVASGVVHRAGTGTVFAITRSSGRPAGSHAQLAFTVPDIDAEVARPPPREVARPPPREVTNLPTREVANPPTREVATPAVSARPGEGQRWRFCLAGTCQPINSQPR